MRESSSSLAALRQRVARLADSGAPSGGGDGGWLASGHATLPVKILQLESTSANGCRAGHDCEGRCS